MLVYLNVLETESDKVIFQKLYEENRQRLYFIAWNILHHEADAEDAVHNCFLKMANNFHSYRHKTYDQLAKISTTAVKRAAIDIVREYKRRAGFTDELHMEDSICDQSTDLLEQMIQEYDKQLITQAIRKLPIEDRELLELQYFMNMKPKDIAKILGIKPEQVRKKNLRTRNKLASIMEEMKNEGL